MPSLDDIYDLGVGEYSDGSIRKGLAYWKQGRVKEVKVRAMENGMGFEVTGEVQGSARKPYKVGVGMAHAEAGEEWDVENMCSCPLGGTCKHGIALLAAAYGELGKRIAQANAAWEVEEEASEEQEVYARVEEMLDLGTRDWLWRVTAAREGEGRHAPVAVEKKLVYVVAREEQRGCIVTLRRLQRLKNGEWGKATPVAMSGKPSTWGLPEEDLGMVREMASEWGAYGGQFALTGKFGAEMVRRLVATGRCHWKEVKGPVMRWGEAREGKLGWEMQEDGSQKAVVKMEGAAVAAFLPLGPVLYVEAGGTCGELSTAEGAAVTRQWLAAPSVRPETSAGVAEAVKRAGLPVPEALPVVAREKVKPVPVLRGERMNLAEGRWKYVLPRLETRELGVMRMWFEYDGVRVGVEEFEEQVTVVRGGRVEVIARSDRAEQRRIREVEDTGLAPLSELTYGYEKALDDLYTFESAGEWPAFVGDVVPELRRKGWRVEFDDAFPFRIAEVEGWYSEAGEGRENDWFDIELGVMVEGERVNLLPALHNILKLLGAQERAGERVDFVDMRLPDGRFVKLPAERLKGIGEMLTELFDPGMEGKGKVRVGRLRAAELTELPGAERWKAGKELKELGEKLKGFERVAAVEPPAGLRAELRSYQKQGLAWLQFLREFGFGGILADDMGLGKTVQMLAHLLLEKERGRAEGPSLVVCPTSLVANWEAEAAKFAPGLRVLVSHGSGRHGELERMGEYDLVVTTYSLLPRDAEALKGQAFHVAALDEAQYIKNPHAKWADAARGLTAKHRVCMTGTPMENHLGELWSLMAFLAPGYLGTQQQFGKVFRTPIEKQGDGARKAALAKRLKPFVLRRRKDEVALELPAKTEMVRAVELGSGQRDLYEAIRIAMHERVREEIEKRGMARSQIVILDALLKLRQACCDPRLVKLEKAKKVKESAKLEMLREMVPEMIAEGRRILLFSQFTSMLDLIEPEMEKAGVPYVRLTGETVDRGTVVRRFQKGGVPLFLISLKAGGTGLNLTAADTVIHYDPWWNPAVEAQATDRAHRIGQEKPVFVYKLITKGTVEEKIVALQERKRELVAGLLDGGSGGKVELTREDLEGLFAG